MDKNVYNQFRTALLAHIQRVVNHDPEAFESEPDRIVICPSPKGDEIELQWDEYAMGNFLGIHSVRVPMDEILADDPDAALEARVEALRSKVWKELQAAHQQKEKAARETAKRDMDQILAKYPELKETL